MTLATTYALLYDSTGKIINESSYISKLRTTRRAQSTTKSATGHCKTDARRRLQAKQHVTQDVHGSPRQPAMSVFRSLAKPIPTKPKLSREALRGGLF